jgi:hypothetical protein
MLYNHYMYMYNIAYNRIRTPAHHTKSYTYTINYNYNSYLVLTSVRFTL